MAAEKQTSVTVLSYEVDSGSISRVVKATDKVQNSIADSLEVLGDYAPVTKMAMRSIEVGFNTVERAVREQYNAVDDLQDMYTSLARTEDQLTDGEWLDALRAEGTAAEQVTDSYQRLEAAKRGAADVQPGRGGNATENARQGLGDLSSLLGAGSSALGVESLSGAGDLLGFIEYAPLAVGALAALTPPMIALTAAGAALALVIGENQKRFKEAKEDAEEYVALQGQVNELLAGGTTSADLQGVIDRQQADIDRIQNNTTMLEGFQSRLDEAQAAAAAAQDAMINPLTEFDEAGNLIPTDSEPALQRYMELQAAEVAILAELSAATEGKITDEARLSEVLVQNSENQGALEDSINATSAALYTAEVAANDAAQALAESTAIRDRAVQREMDINRELDAMTAEQRRERIQELTREREALQQAISYQGISTEYHEELSQQLDNVNERIAIFGSNLDTTADRAERSAKALEALEEQQQIMSDLTDQLFTAQERETQAKEAAINALNEYTKAEFAFSANIAKIQTDYNAKRGETEDKAREEQEKAADASAKRIADITRKSNVTLANAIGARDALAYFLAKQAAKEQIDSEKESLKEREKELRDSLRKQLEDQDKAARQAVDREKARWEEEKQTRLRAQQQIAVDLQNAENAVKAIRQNANVQSLALMELRVTGEMNAYSGMARNADFWLTYMEDRNARAWEAMAAAMGNGGGGGTGRPTPTPFAMDSDVTRTGLALLHAGERVYPPIQSAGRQSLSQSTITNNNMGGFNPIIKGVSRAAIRREVNRELDRVLDAAGID